MQSPCGIRSFADKLFHSLLQWKPCRLSFTIAVSGFSFIPTKERRASRFTFTLKRQFGSELLAGAGNPLGLQ
jgi:hypothetical protein